MSDILTIQMTKKEFDELPQTKTENSDQNESKYLLPNGQWLYINKNSKAYPKAIIEILQTVKRGPVEKQIAVEKKEFVGLKAHAYGRREIQQTAKRMADTLSDEQSISLAIQILVDRKIPFNLIVIHKGDAQLTNTMRDGYEICRHIIDQKLGQQTANEDAR